MIYYAVIDTNILVSALLSKHEDAATVQILERVILGDYEVVVEKHKENAFLITGNMKHFPIKPYIVTANQMLKIIEENE